MKELGLDNKSVDRCKNFFALGMCYWLYNRSMETTLRWIESKFKSKPTIVNANRMAMQAGYSYCEATEAFQVSTSPTAFHRVWSPSNGNPNGSPIVAGGLVWALDWNNALLYGMNAVNGHVVVRRATENLEHFVAPGVGDGMLFVPTSSGVEAFRTIG